MKTFFLFMFSFLFLSTGILLSQPAEIPYHVESYKLESGFYNGSNQAGNTVEVFSGIVRISDFPWMGLHFNKVNLGNESYVIITSLKDGYWQKLDAVTIEQWSNFSALFNGQAVEIQLFAAPFDKDVFISIDEIIVGDWYGGSPYNTICGPTDDRIYSDHPASGRLLSVGCTAWIIPNGKIVSAGHCLSSAGSVNVLEFNVPLSLPNGTIQHPPPEDQYAADVSTRVYTNGGLGNDWGVFEVFPNSITGLMPKEAQGSFFVLQQDLGPDSIRITGFGVDDGEANQTQQTHIGPNAGSSGTTMRYRTDTQGGNSGSPVINGLTGVAVGVHTHGGCTSSGGNNNGTSTFHPDFWAAVDGGAGGCPVETPSDPNPVHGTLGVSINLTELSWTNGAGAVTNELYFGSDPGSLSLVQSGSLATSWTITGGPFEYSTTYYWQVVEIGDTCSTNGAVWNFRTETDPNIVCLFEDYFDANITQWTVVGPLGLTNWSWQSTNNALGTAVGELQFSWDPSFVGDSYIMSPVIPSAGQSLFINFNHYVDYWGAGLTVGCAYTVDGGTTWTTIWDVVDPPGNVGPELIQLASVPGDANFQLGFFYTGDSFQIDYWYVDDVFVCYIIPVELTSFTASVNARDVTLNWTTATELNNQGFEIERNSGNGFQNISYVAGFGTSTETHSYSFVDASLNEGIYSYRLKQIDLDGSFEYFDIIEVDITVPDVFALEQNYPNPFNPSTKIKFALPVKTQLQLNVYNMLGEKVAEVFSGTLEGGFHEFVFDGTNLSSGVYIYRIESDKFTDSKKMSIVK